MNTDLLNATLVDRHDLSQELAVIRVRLDRGSTLSFEPGQYTTIGLPQPLGASVKRPKLLQRAYSIASSPDQHDHLEFYVVLVPNGQLTPRLWNVDVGGRLWIGQKAKGHFTLERVPRNKDLVMIGTGTGLAPYMSMLRAYRGQDRWRRFVVIHGVRLAQDCGYRHELEQAAAQDPTVVYIPTVTREPEDSSWRGMRGRVQTVLEEATYQRLVGAPLVCDRCHVFLCGHGDMIHTVQTMLEAKGFSVATSRTPGNLHVERYW